MREFLMPRFQIVATVMCLLYSFHVSAATICYDSSAPAEVWIQKLKSKDPKERKIGAYVLGGYGQRGLPAIPILTSLLDDSDSLVNIHAAGALGRILAHVTGAESSGMQAHQTAQMRRRAIDAGRCANFRAPYARFDDSSL